MKIETLPKDLPEAIELLKIFYGKYIKEIKALPEKEFLSSSHFMAGMFLRNSWKLWWQNNKMWKGEPKPLLNAWFNSIGITHADDMSSIILTSFHRSLNGKTLNVESQVRRYQKHWKKQGFSDGIPKMD